MQLLDRPTEFPIERVPDKLSHESTRRLPNLDALTSLRFFAASGLFFMHAQGMGLLYIFANSRDLYSLSQAVNFFFCLSGFVLSYKYKDLSTKEKLISYLGNRVARAAPLYYLSAIPFLFLPGLMHFSANPIKDVACYFFFLQDWDKVGSIAPVLNPPAHSMSSEVFYYLVLPFLLLVKRKWLGALCGTIICTFIGLHYINPALTLAISYPAVTGLPYFLGGIISQELYTRWGPTLCRFAQLDRKAILYFTLAEVVILACCVPMARSIVYPTPVETSMTILGVNCSTVPVMVLSQVLLFGMLVFTFALESGIVSRLLKLRPFVVLGTASFALFLIHCAVLFLIQSASANLPSRTAFPLGWLGLIVSITISLLLYRYVEEPLRIFITSSVRNFQMNSTSPSSSDSQVSVNHPSLTLREFVKQMGLRFVLPTSLICSLGLATPFIFSKYGTLTSASVFEQWTKLRQPVIPGSESVQFGDSAQLIGVKQVNENGTTSLRTLWKAKKDVRTDLGFLATHLLNEKGDIVRNLDHKLVPAGSYLQKDQVWEDIITIPRQIGIVKCGLALYDDQTKTCGVIQGGTTDWAGRRLVLPIAQSIPNPVAR